MKEIDRENGKIILGHGETTGHNHTVRDPGARLFRIDEDRRMLRLPTEALLRHERGDTPAEHRDICLPAGEPVVIHKRRYTADGGWTKVQD